MAEEYSRENPSPRYRELLALYQQMHDMPDMFAGISLPRQADRIRRMVEDTKSSSILDYGSGKGKPYEWIPQYWGVKDVVCYDPAYKPFSELPTRTFDGVISTDVLEHCPAEDTPWILREMFSFADKFVFANIASYPAVKTLPNGENAHCTIWPAERWRQEIEAAAKPGVLWEAWVETIENGILTEYRMGASHG